MRPVLFDSRATTYDTNGLGRLECVSCVVTEERNGMYELEAQVPESAELASSLEMDSILLVKPSQGASMQAFRVYKITKPINGLFTVQAQHISYQLSNIPTMPFSMAASSSACAQVLAALKSNSVESCPFSFWTDVTTISSYNQTIPASIRQRLGGVEGSVLDQYGGEYEWDNWTVKLHKNRGVVVPTATLKYGKNITDLTQEEEISSTVTGVCPYWQSEVDGTVVTVTLPEKVVESQYADNYAYRRTIPLDLTQDFQSQPTVAQLRAAARAFVNQAELGIPKVSIDVSFVHLADTEEYKDIAPLETVNLCDRINVYFEKLGVSTTAKVVKTVYNVLTEKYESIEVGSIRSGLATTIASQDTAISEMQGVIFKDIDGKINSAINSATAWLTSSGGYVVAVKNDDGTWKELLFLDSDDTETAKNVLRINENGIGFSSSGVDGPYTQAWTLDGKLVIGGTNVPSLTVCDNSNNVLFQIDSSGMAWNSQYSSMAKSGLLSSTIEWEESRVDYQGNPFKYYYQRRVEFGNGKFVMYGRDRTSLDSDSWDNVPWRPMMTIHGDHASHLAGIVAYEADLNLRSRNNIYMGADEAIWISAPEVYMGDSAAGTSETGIAGGLTYTGTYNGMRFINGMFLGTE